MRKRQYYRQQPKAIAIAATAKRIDALIWTLPLLAALLLMAH